MELTPILLELIIRAICADNERDKYLIIQQLRNEYFILTEKARIREINKRMSSMFDDEDII